MVYNWDGKEQECYRLYVEERKSLDEVVEYWKERGFTPSKRAFQTQFKRWSFPSKQDPAHRNPALIARVKELWETNTMQKDMVLILSGEGYRINDRELLRLRLRYQWLLRESRSDKGKSKKNTGDGGLANVPFPITENSDAVQGSGGLVEQLESAILDGERPSSHSGSEHFVQVAPVSVSPRLQSPTRSPSPLPLDPEEALRRQIRLSQLQVESDEKWASRKRRRRTRGWASLPADAPGEPPRFPSETTLDESKSYLSLDNILYKQVRAQFQRICEEEDVLKKTIAGPEKWGQLKRRLVQENAHLSSIFGGDAEAMEQLGSGVMSTPTNRKALSIDVICTDVTKRLRVLGSKMGIPKAKKALGINPTEARRLRDAFHDILKADHFTNKLEAGDQHWEELKQSWIQGSDVLTRILAPGEADPKYMEKMKAVGVLGRDVMKRFRAQSNLKNPSKTVPETISEGPGPRLASPSMGSYTPQTNARANGITSTGSIPTNDDTSDHLAQSSQSVSATEDYQIDPSLLLAVSDPSMLPDSTSTAPQHTMQQSSNAMQHQYQTQPQQHCNTSIPLPIYFRLHQQSITSMPHKTVWLGVFTSPTIHEIRSLATHEHPGTVAIRLDGLVVHKMPGQADTEVVIAVDDEDELAAYLQHVRGRNGKATFIVTLASAEG